MKKGIQAALILLGGLFSYIRPYANALGMVLYAQPHPVTPKVYDHPAKCIFLHVGISMDYKGITLIDV